MRPDIVLVGEAFCLCIEVDEPYTDGAHMTKSYTRACEGKIFVSKFELSKTFYCVSSGENVGPSRSTPPTQ